MDQKPTITFDDFSKIDLRVARVTNCESIPKSDKLWKLTLDVGPLGQRVICASVKKQYPFPDGLIGQNIVLVSNLAPRSVMGVQSEGMLLAGANDDHTVVRVLSSDGAGLSPGDTIG